MTLTEEPVRVFTGSAGSVVRLLDDVLGDCEDPREHELCGGPGWSR